MIKKILYFLLALVFKLIPRNKHLWITGKASEWVNGSVPPAFFDNSKYFFLYLVNFTSEKVYWLSSSKEEIKMLKKMGLPVVKFPSFRGIFLTLRAKYSFHHYGTDQINSILQRGSVQLDFWHGTPLKKIRYDVVGKPQKKKRLLRDLISKGDIEYVFSTSCHLSEKILSNAFDVNICQLLNFGYPRMDVLKLKDNKNLAFCEKYSPELMRYIEKAQKYNNVLLYMPTFRDDDPNYFEKSGIDYNRLSKKLKDIDGVIFLKLHPLTNHISLEGFDNIIQIDNSVDIYPFLIYTDFLITDYSSIYFDYLVLNKEIIFVPYDYDNYIKHRELYFDYDSITPGIKYKSFEEFIDNFDNLRDLDYSSDRKKVMELLYDDYDYNSCERTYEFIKAKYQS